MATIPRAVLSEHFQERMAGRRLLAAVFLTFRFDPGFFEQDILPTFLDIPLSHAPAIRRIQLDDALRSVPHGIAVYYDHNGIAPEAGAAKLDIRRIPVCHRTGIFHPKNIFALVEDTTPDKDGHHPQALLVASLSANLTRSGWWENVEVCHTEEIVEGKRTRLKDGCIRLLEGLERRVGAKASDGHAALKAIRGFLRRETSQGGKRVSGGVLHTHFYDGSQEFTTFLESMAGRSLDGMNLEIISPYFNDHASSLPLSALIDRFRPKEVRVYLPRNEGGEPLCTREVLEHVRNLPDVNWGVLPVDLVKSGKGEQARPRQVHAKVYRFFRSSPKAEVLFVGSVNLTSAAHSSRGNLETGFLVQLDNPPRPDWWLTPESGRAGHCAPRPEDEGIAASGGTALSLRYTWHSGEAEAYWDGPHLSPPLEVQWQGTQLFQLDPIPSRAWVTLSEDTAAALKQVLTSTSLLTVIGEGTEPGLLLVQEEGMHARPSLLFDLTPADILRYWALLTPAQRAEFLSSRAPELAQSDEGAALLASVAKLPHEDTFFDRFAGIFLAFGCLERAVRAAIPDNPKEAAYRLFGQKHDSLPHLLDKVMEESTAGRGDLLEQYVTALCASQLVRETRRSFPEFYDSHPSERGALGAQLKVAEALRARIVGDDSAEMAAFLDWFEPLFLGRAAPIAGEQE